MIVYFLFELFINLLATMVSTKICRTKQWERKIISTPFIGRLF